MSARSSPVLQAGPGARPDAARDPTREATPSHATSRESIRPVELEHHRAALTRYARWLLGEGAAAEDAVQETLLAALQSPERFAGRSSVRTWLFGILKHKVVDIVRRRSRELPFDEDSGQDACAAAAQFVDNGHWREPPLRWGDPEAMLDQQRFFEVLERCIDKLPTNIARVFTMRELMDMDTHAICEAVGISSNNCFVMLHRARTMLRDLLHEHWFRDLPAAAGANRNQCSTRSPSANL
jgi:RNA polymerase sigma-70 factor, ECF subfamily